MHSIESELHTLLDTVLGETAPSCYTCDETARIIAEASAIVKNKFTHAKINKVASKDPQFREAQLLDSLVQAMGSLTETIEEVYENSYIDGRGLNPKSIIQQASRLPVRKAYELLNDDDLSVFNEDRGEEFFDGGFFDLDDGREYHDPSVFSLKGKKKHRTDSQAR